MTKVAIARHARLVGRASRLILGLGAGLLSWGLLMRDDGGHHAVIWDALQFVGLALVLGASPFYGWYALRRAQSDREERLPNSSQLALLRQRWRGRRR
jgi:hypothetical protein